MRENTVETEFKKQAKTKCWFCLKWLGLIKGIPDQLCFRRGRVLMAEIKAPGKVPEKKQLKMHRQLWRCGFKVHVPDTPGEVIALFSLGGAGY